jgi:hypothetical protein
MFEDLVKEAEVTARAETIRRSLSEGIPHERATKAESPPSADHQSLISPPCSLHNLSRALDVAGRRRIANPCVFRKPFMRRIAVWTVGLPKKYRARAESRRFDVSAGGNCPPGFRATNHKNTHQANSRLWRAEEIPLMCDEKIKAQRQFKGVLAARRSRRRRQKGSLFFLRCEVTPMTHSRR